MNLLKNDEDFLFVELDKTDSSLIRAIEFIKDTGGLHIVFQDNLDIRYFPDAFYYCVPEEIVRDMLDAKSIGNFYNTYIKNQLNMAERPKTVNKSSKQKRYIDISINVDKINKEWIIEGEKGRYLNVSLAMLPDGQLDKFGNLGMVTQKVPKDVWKEDKNIRGEILGNAAEFERAGMEGAPGATEGKRYEESEDSDGLPF